MSLLISLIIGGTVLIILLATGKLKKDSNKQNNDGHNDNSKGQRVPSHLTLTPADNSSGIGVNDSLVIKFNETIVRDTGLINIFKTSSSTPIESFTANDAIVTISTTTLTNDTVTINPKAPLEYGEGYHVNISATSFKDLENNYYSGISGTETWNFTTRKLVCSDTEISIPGFCIPAEVDDNSYSTYIGYRLKSGTTFTATGTMKDINDHVRNKGGKYWSNDDKWACLYCTGDCTFTKEEGSFTYNNI